MSFPRVYSILDENNNVVSSDEGGAAQWLAAQKPEWRYGVCVIRQTGSPLGGVTTWFYPGRDAGTSPFSTQLSGGMIASDIDVTGSIESETYAEALEAHEVLVTAASAFWESAVKRRRELGINNSVLLLSSGEYSDYGIEYIFLGPPDVSPLSACAEWEALRERKETASSLEGWLATKGFVEAPYYEYRR